MRRGVRASFAVAGRLGLGLGLALAASGCGVAHRDAPASGGYTRPPSAAPESPPAPVAAPSVGSLELRTKETRYGRILVDGRDMTIYVSARDDAGFESTCSGPCTKEWPPLFTNGQVTAGPGVNSAWVGTIGRSDGPTQVEYDGWPLYRSTRDDEPGDINGQRVRSNGTTWYVIDADKGKKVA
jgi:predicted lipoprotein with Yx(FWY)xxD motif